MSRFPKSAQDAFSYFRKTSLPRFLDNIKVVTECLVTVASTDHAILSTHVAVNFQAKKNNSFVLKLTRKIYRFLVACLENLYKADAINVEVIN